MGAGPREGCPPMLTAPSPLHVRICRHSSAFVDIPGTLSGHCGAFRRGATRGDLCAKSQVSQNTLAFIGFPWLCLAFSRVRPWLSLAFPARATWLLLAFGLAFLGFFERRTKSSALARSSARLEARCARFTAQRERSRSTISKQPRSSALAAPRLALMTAIPFYLEHNKNIVNAPFACLLVVPAHAWESLAITLRHRFCSRR